MSIAIQVKMVGRTVPRRSSARTGSVGHKWSFFESRCQPFVNRSSLVRLRKATVRDGRFAPNREPRPSAACRDRKGMVRGEVKTGVAQRAAVAAHAAAREATEKAAVAVARAAGHAVATVHFADHCLGPVIYGAKAVEAAGGSVDDERAWQLARLPDKLRTLVISALAQRRTRRT
jgi:hypothetical protein